MEKLTQKELIRDSHQKLANDYYEWFLLLFHYTDKIHAHDFKISSKDRLELERNPKYIHEIMKKNYNLDITLESERTKYKETKHNADLYFEYMIHGILRSWWIKHNKRKGFMGGSDIDFLKDLVESVGKEKTVAIGILLDYNLNREISLEHEDSLLLLGIADEHRILSIIYDNYEEIVEILKTNKNIVENVYYLIESYRDQVKRLCGELIGYWISEKKRIKLTRKRIKSGSTTLQKKKADRKQPVLEAYYRIRTDERQKMSKNKIATTIRKDLDKMLREPPSLSTIKRYLEEENLI